MNYRLQILFKWGIEIRNVGIFKIYKLLRPKNEEVVEPHNYEYHERTRNLEEELVQHKVIKLYY